MRAHFLAAAALSLGCGEDPSVAPGDPPHVMRLPVCENVHGTLQDGDFETVGSLEVTHRFRLASEICWHYVEAGAGDAVGQSGRRPAAANETVVFIHGFPESWWSWHAQLEALASEFHVVAIDMKAYGQTGKPDGDYHVVRVAEEIFGLVGELSAGPVNVVSHDWGSIISEAMTCTHPERIGRFVRMEAPLLIVDLANAPQLELFKDQAFAREIMSNPEGLVALAHGRLTLQPLPDAVLARIADEFRYPGIADMVPKYFRDLDLDPAGPQRALRTECFSAMTFPVLLLQADSDRNQPAYYFDGATDLFPDAQLQWVTSSGHFSELEQPDQVSAAVREFLQR